MRDIRRRAVYRIELWCKGAWGDERTESNTTTAYTSQSSDGPPLEKTTSRFARALAFSASSPEGKEKERERAEKREPW
ncbi:hypothetical protein MY4824_001117 [Beauveria thailandica]